MRSIWPNQIRLAIFDNDGTLMDTEWAYSWVHEKITGQKLDWDLKATLMGKSSLETCRQMCHIYNLNESPESLMKRRTEMVSACWKDIKLLPGAADIIEGLKSRGIKLAIATSSRREVFNQKSASLQDFVGKFDYIVTGDDVQRGKPEPDIFLTALAHFDGIKPCEAVVFEDSPLGIKAANKAGMASVFVPDSHLNAKQALGEQGAVPNIVIPSLSAFEYSTFQFTK